MDNDNLTKKLHSNSRKKALSEILSKRLIEGEQISDLEFDQVFPQKERSLSEIHWTPVSTVKAILKILNPDCNTKLLDVGSGVGKFCILASLLSDALITGVEQRSRLHFIAQKTASLLSAKRINFIYGDAFDLDWNQFNSFYFYNPFQEHLVHECAPVIDTTISLNRKFFEQYTAAVCQKLRSLRSGTKVITYHGMGSDLPSTYQMISSQDGQSDMVRLWIKL